MTISAESPGWSSPAVSKPVFGDDLERFIFSLVKGLNLKYKGFMKGTTKRPRTAAGLRDMLFDELEELQGPEPNPHKSLAVSKLAAQIISVARAEVELQQKLSKNDQLCDDYQMGELRLGERKHAAGAAASVTDQ